MSGQLEPNYCAIRDYRPLHDGEIELVAGDSITNVKDLTNGWMLGRNATRNTVGIFPSHLILPDTGPAPPAGPGGTTPRPPSVADPPPPAVGGAPDGRATGPLVDITDSNFDPNDFPPPPTEEELVLPPGGDPPSIPAYGPPVSTKPAPNTYEKLAAGGKRRKSKDKGSREVPEGPGPGDQPSSLPSPRKGRYGRPAPKPHMFVRPNAGKSIFRQPSDTSVKGGAGSGDSDGQGSPEECRARTYSNPSCQSTPTPTRHRTSAPPGQLPAPQGPVNEDDDFMMVVDNSDLDSPLGQQATVIANHVSPEQEADYGPQSGAHSHPQPHPHPHPQAARVATLEPADRQNLANEARGATPPAARKEPKPQQFYSDYRTLECPPAEKPPSQVQKRYKPILKNRHHHQNAAGYGPPAQKANEICYRDERETRRSFRLVCSVLAGLLVGLVLFVWMFYALQYPFMVAVLTALSVALLCMLALAVSRLCRCVAGLMLPSVCTTRGRLAFLVLITGFLLDGPVTNIYVNMGEVSRAMSCSAEQSYNQSMLLLQPFDAMMQNLNHTVYRLREAAHNVSVGLKPLDNGLDMAEADLYNAGIELTGTERVGPI